VFANFPQTAPYIPSAEARGFTALSVNSLDSLSAKVHPNSDDIAGVQSLY